MTAIHELFEELRQITHAHHHLDDFEEYLQLPSQIGKGQIQNWHLRDALELHVQAYECRENTVFESSVQQSFLKLGFCLSGEVLGLEPGFELKAGQSLLLTRSTDQTARTEVSAKQPIRVVEIVLPAQLLNTLRSEELLPTELQADSIVSAGLYAKAGAITPAMTISLQQILNCPYRGVTKQLYLESKALELITFHFEEHHNQKQQTEDRFRLLRGDDIDRIYQAKVILLDNLSAPPSLMSLARQVGLNDYKLKLGFRQIFGTTAFGYLHQCRMDQARHLLETTQLSLDAIALDVGYASLSSFHRAFKKRFGVNPRTCRLNRY
jgi:AraC-like DNA-binding protein